MSIKIEITSETGAEAREKMRDLLGGITLEQFASQTAASPNPNEIRAGVALAAAALEEKGESPMGEMLAAAEASAAEPAKEPARRTRKKAEPQISTNPENRVPPPEPEAAAQDAADEQAEVDANTKADAPLTGDDVRNAMTAYVDKHGIAATQEDGMAITMDALGKPPAGAEAWAISVIVGAGQETIAKAVKAWSTAAASAARYKGRG